jgi:hypothetical protein
MQTLPDRILTLNLIATTAVFYVAARIYLLPRLGQLRPSAVLIPILLLHSLRHLGLMFFDAWGHLSRAGAAVRLSGGGG